MLLYFSICNQFASIAYTLCRETKWLHQKCAMLHSSYAYLFMYVHLSDIVCTIQFDCVVHTYKHIAHPCFQVIKIAILIYLLIEKVCTVLMTYWINYLKGILCQKLIKWFISNLGTLACNCLIKIVMKCFRRNKLVSNSNSLVDYVYIEENRVLNIILISRTMN